MIYKGKTISVIPGTENLDNGDWYFHVKTSEKAPTIKALCKQNKGEEVPVKIGNTNYIVLSCKKERFLPIWDYEKKTKGEMMSIMAHFNPGP